MTDNTRLKFIVAHQLYYGKILSFINEISTHCSGIILENTQKRNNDKQNIIVIILIILVYIQHFEHVIASINRNGNINVNASIVSNCVIKRESVKILKREFNPSARDDTMLKLDHQNEMLQHLFRTKYFIRLNNIFVHLCS